MKRLLAFALSVMTLPLASAAFADSPRVQLPWNGGSHHQHTQQHVQPRVGVSPTLQIDPHQNRPTLGIRAITRSGCVEVTERFYGTPASRMGLEAGDRILEINGRSIRSVFDLRAALQDAVRFHHGQVSLLVDNVRARHGHHGVQRYVTVHTYLDGYSRWAHHGGGSHEVYTARRR